MVGAPLGEMYFSADVESDGPIPGPFSMLSLGLVPVATYDGRQFRRLRFEQKGRYWEFRPISNRFESEALAVNGLNRQRLQQEGSDPEIAMAEVHEWILGEAAGFRPVLVAYPAAFDWSFISWYFAAFAGGSPFGHGSCIDVRSFYMGATGSTYADSAKANVPARLRPRSPHTHNALDDAVEQGELFSNIFEWALERHLLAAD